LRESGGRVSFVYERIQIFWIKNLSAFVRSVAEVVIGVRAIEVVPYDPNWATQFRREAAHIFAVLGPEVIAIHHIGSTAIPTIKAKPIIDILVEVRYIELIDAFNQKMRELGYQPKGEFGIPGRRFFLKHDEITRTHHVHVFQVGAPEVQQHLNFRDYLIVHPEVARAYSRLKEQLVQLFPEDIERYMDGKDEFIKGILHRAKVWRDRSR